MFESFFEKVDKPFRSDFGHNANVLIWLWGIYVSLFLFLLVRDFFSARRKILFGKDLDDGEKRGLPLSMRLNWLFIAAGAFLNLYQIQYIMFHNSGWWTGICCSLFLLELSLLTFEIYRSKSLSRFLRNDGHSSTGTRLLHATSAVAAWLLPIFCAFIAQAQYFHDQQFIGC